LALAATASLAGLWIAGDSSFVGLAGASPAAMTTLLLGSVSVAVLYRAAGRWSTVAAIGLRVVAVILLAGSCFVLLDLIQLAIDGRVGGPNGDTHWLTFGQRLVSGLLGVLFWIVSAAHSGRRCQECGLRHDDEVVSVVPAAAAKAGPAVRRLALAGCVSFAPYLGIHGAHAAGLAPQLDSLYEEQSILPGPPVVAWALFVVCLVGPAVFLLQGLVQAWGVVFPRWIPWIGGRRVPRFLPIVPAWIVAPTLALYGYGSIVYALSIHASLWGLGGAASLAFSCYGTAVIVAALSYQRRTAPIRLCPTSPVQELS
jgi:hypothetical protein